MQLAHWVAIATLAALPLAATAQEKSKNPDPADPAAAVRSVPYESAFTGYQAVSEANESPEKLWRTVNDEMGRLGGHVGHTRQTPTAPDSMSKDMPKSEPMPAGHGMHQKKKEGQ